MTYLSEILVFLEMYCYDRKIMIVYKTDEYSIVFFVIIRKSIRTIDLRRLFIKLRTMTYAKE